METPVPASEHLESGLAPEVDDRLAPTHERQRGQGIVEYALILTIVVIVLVLSVQVIGHQTTSMFSNIQTGFNGH